MYLTAGNSHIAPDHIHKASAAAAGQAEEVCNPHTAGPALGSSWDTVLGCPGMDHSLAAALGKLAGLDTAAAAAAAEVDSLAAVGVLADRLPAVGYTVNYLLEGLVHHDCTAPHNNPPGQHIAEEDLAVAVCTEALVSVPLHGCLG